MQVSFEAKEIERLWKGLRRYNEKAIPFAARAAINESAFELRKRWRREVNRNFITRNRWTVGSIFYEKTKSLSLPFMFSEVGSEMKYMKTQETGGTERKKGKHGVAIPTSVASREGRGTKPRRRVPAPAYRPIKKIRLGRRYNKIGTRKERFAAAVAEARRTGRKLVFLELRNNRKGIFRVGGSKKNPKIDMLYDLSRSSIRIPREPTLEKSLNDIERTLPGIYLRALMAQWKRHKIGNLK